MSDPPRAAAASDPARLLLPALRADADGGFRSATDDLHRALARGAGGFIVFGGRPIAAADLIRHARATAAYPLLFAADLERGPGQQFDGLIALPPAAALGYLDDLEITRRAGYVTGRGARRVGIDCVFAPVADLDVEPRNPIVGTRAFGADPRRVAAHVAAWIDGCRSAGALACAKHFPGHGRTVEDSHLEAARVTAPAEALEDDLLPFRVAIDAGVDAMMTAHVAYPALDGSGRPATLSRGIVDGLLRDRLGFRGAVVTDALGMKGLSGGEAGSAIAALEAGCDLLLYPEDLDAVVTGVARGQVAPERIREALERRDGLLGRISDASADASEDDAAWSAAIAERAVVSIRGEPRLPALVALQIMDDDVGGPHPPPSREAFRSALHGAAVEVGDGGTTCIALFADTRGWKGRAGLSDRAVETVRRMCHADPDARVILFGHPRIADQIPFAPHVACAWGGEPLMQQAAARALTNAVSRHSASVHSHPGESRDPGTPDRAR